MDGNFVQQEKITAAQLAPPDTRALFERMLDELRLQASVPVEQVKSHLGCSLRRFLGFFCKGTHESTSANQLRTEATNSLLLELDSAVLLFKSADFVQVVVVVVFVFVFISKHVISNKRCSDLYDRVGDVELFRI